MGTYARNIQEIQNAVQNVPEDGGLIAIPLFDNGKSHRKVLDFFQDRGEFIDGLSAHSGIFTIMLSARFEAYVDPPEWLAQEAELTVQQESELETLEQATYFVNPSGEIAKLFGIPPRDFPGLVFFRALPDQTVQEPVYARLDLDLFTDAEAVEEVLRHIYSEAFEASRRSRGAEQFLDNLRSRLTARRRKKRFGPILKAIGERLEPLTRVPEKFVDAVIEATVQEGRRLF